MAENDAQLELKKRARRRLIGAVALALAAAVILPMVMDSEPRPTGNDLQIRIPSQEGSNYTSRVISTNPPNTSATSSAAPIVAPGDPEMGPVSSSSTATSTASSFSSASSKATSSAHAQSSTAAVSAEARARSLLEQGVEPGEQRFFVQIGVYREAENAKSVATQVKHVGMVPSVEKVGASTRVRIGPFKTRQAADAALEKLKKVKLNGVVTGK